MPPYVPLGRVYYGKVVKPCLHMHWTPEFQRTGCLLSQPLVKNAIREGKLTRGQQLCLYSQQHSDARGYLIVLLSLAA